MAVKKMKKLSAVAAMMEGFGKEDLVDDIDHDDDIDIELESETSTHEQIHPKSEVTKKYLSNKNTRDSITSKNVLRISCDLIDLWKYTDRSDSSMGDLDALEKSIKIFGQKQPALVRPNGNRYELIFGHRRYLACKRLGIEIYCSVEDIDDRTAAAIQVTENSAREDISDFDRAMNFEKLLSDKIFKDASSLAESMNLSLTKVYEILTIVNLPFEIKEQINLDRLSSRTSSELLSICKNKKYEPILDYLVSICNSNPRTRELKNSADAKLRSLYVKEEQEKVPLTNISRIDKKETYVFTVSIEKNKVKNISETESKIQKLIAEYQ